MLGNVNTFKNGREWKCRMTTLNNGAVYDGSIIGSFTLTTSQDTSKIIGATIGKQLEIELFTTKDVDFNGLIKLEIGLKCWNEQTKKWYYEWMNLGQSFKAESIEQVKYKTKLTCFDAMVYKFEGKYTEGSTADMTTTVALQNHIAEKFGITFDTVVPNFEIINPAGETYREIIGYLAICCASNAYYSNSQDMIKFAPLVKTSTDLIVDKKYYFSFSEDRSEFTIKRVNLDMGTGFGYYAGESGATKNEEVTVKLPFANQDIANYVYDKIKGYQQVGYDLKLLANPQVEIFDQIKLTTIDDVVYNLQVQNSKLVFNGGLTQELSATKMSQVNNTTSYVENKFASSIKVLSDKIELQVSDLTDKLNQTQSSITLTKDEILSQVETQFVKKTENKAYSIILSNEFQNIPTNSEGYPLEDGSFECGVRVFNGSTELTDFQMSISATNSYGIDVSVDNTNKKVVFTYKKTTKITKNGDEITVYIRIDNETTLEKKISWTKTSNGVDGTSFNIKGTLGSEADLPSNAVQGDAYIIGGFLYVFTEEGTWSNVGKIQGENGASINCNIVANSLVFKSGDGGKIYNPQTIVLTAVCSNCNLLRWEYYHNEWKSVTTYAPDLLNGDTISINYDNSLLNTLGNQITFKAVTDVEGVIDIVTITKLSVLDNEVETIKEISKSQIDQKANEILSTVETTFLKKTEAGDFVTTEEMNSAIDQKANEINLSVSTKVTEEVSKVELGVRNLVLESMPKETGSSSTAFARRNIVELKNETTYTLTANGHINSTTSEAYLKVRIYRDDDISEQWHARISNDKDITAILTFTTTNKCEGHQYYIESLLMPSDADGTATINWYKLEQGVLATDWTPAPEDTNAQMEALKDMTNDLQAQIDGKIETYFQNTDPSTEWTTTELKTQHIGDIWHNSLENITYRWSGSAWNKLTDSDALQAQALANKKAQVFTSPPTIPYYQNDLWVQGSGGDIMKCITTRTSGSYNPSDWTKASKYTDDTTANNVANNLATNYSTTVQMNSAIDIAKNSITSTVSETYVTKDTFNNATSNLVTKSELTQTSNSITAKFSLDGDNLLRNGRPRTTMKGWDTSCGTGNTGRLSLYNGSCFWDNEFFYSGIWWEGTYSTSNWCSLLNTTLTDFRFNTNKTYSFSMIFHNDSTTANKSITVQICDNDGSNIVADKTFTILPGTQYVQFEFTPKQGGNRPVLAIYLKTTGSFKFYIPWAVVKEGAVTKTWIPNGDEIEEGITTIDKDGVTVSHNNVNTITKMSADGFYIVDSNGENIASLSSKERWTELKADKVFANNIENVYQGDSNLYVDHSNTRVGDGTASNPFSDFASLADYLESTPIIKKNITINVVSTGNVSDNLRLENLKGGAEIGIYLNKNLILNGNGEYTAFYFYNCYNHIIVNGGRTGYDTTDGTLINKFNYGIFFNRCKYGIAEYIAIDTTGAGDDRWGVLFRESNGQTRRVDFTNTPNAVYADMGSNVSDYDSCGNCNIAFESLNGSSIMFGGNTDSGYRPNGSFVEARGDVVELGVRTIKQSLRNPLSKPSTSNQYKDFSFSDYGYYSEGYGNWNSIGYKTIYQGDWGYGNNRGIFTLPNSNISSFLSSSTVLDGNQITLQRENAGGYSSGQTVYLWGTTQTSASGSAPPLTKSYGALGTLAWGERKTFALPKAFVSDLKSGTIKSVMFYTSNGGNYIKFSAVCTLRLRVNK